MSSVPCIETPVNKSEGEQEAGRSSATVRPALAPPASGPVPDTGAKWNSPEFAALYEQHSQPIYYLALRMLADPARAEDATHDVFLKAFRNMRQFRGDSAVRTWLYRIAINHCRNILQSWHHRTMVTNVDDAVWERAPSADDSPLRALETAELGERIKKTLERLSDEQRLLLLLVADQELSYEEIGELTSQSADAVRGKLHRARKAFAVFFKQSE
jgi:RNA polymerase sigma-70 factor (ECF subfamily)